VLASLAGIIICSFTLNCSAAFISIVIASDCKPTLVSLFRVNELGKTIHLSWKVLEKSVKMNSAD